MWNFRLRNKISEGIATKRAVSKYVGDSTLTSKYGSDGSAWVVSAHAWNITVCDSVSFFPENVWESPITPTATFPEIFNRLLFRSILWMCLQNLRFIAALAVPEIIGGTQKIWTVPGYAHAPFSPKCLICFCSDGPCECTGQICFTPSFARHLDNSDCSFGWASRTPNLGEDEVVGFWDGTVRKNVGEFLYALIHQRHTADIRTDDKQLQ